MLTTTTTLLLLAFGAGGADDPLPYFRPDPPAPAPFRAAVPTPELGPPLAHPIAWECAADDADCVSRHDAGVLDAALVVGDDSPCASATAPERCRAAVELITGELPRPPLDRCLWVARVDGREALVLDPATGRTATVVARDGWRARSFAGPCGEMAARAAR